MQLVWWFVGVMATIAGIRFVLMVFKRLTSKENMEAILDMASDGAQNCADKVGNYFHERKKKKDNRPIVTIH